MTSLPWGLFANQQKALMKRTVPAYRARIFDKGCHFVKIGTNLFTSEAERVAQSATFVGRAADSL